MISGMIINGCAASAVHSRQRLYRVIPRCFAKNYYYYYYPLHDSVRTLCHPPIITIMWGLNCPISCRVNFMQITPYLPCSLPKYRQHYVHIVSAVKCSCAFYEIFLELRFHISKTSAYTVNNCSVVYCFPSANQT